MNSYDIFRKLTRGIKFNQKKFKDDLQRIGVCPRDDKTERKVKQEETTVFEETPIHDETSVLTENSSSKDESAIKNKEDEGGGVNILAGVHIDKSSNQTKKKKRKKKKSGGEETEEKSEKQKLFELKTEQVNRIRNKNGISVWGTDVPEPLVSFEKLIEEYKVNKVIANNLRSQGYDEPMPIQMQAWPLLLQGREVLGSAPTGSGKTAAFVVPILHQLEGPKKKGFRAVMLAPTRELAKQTHRECVRLSEGLGLRIHIINNVNRAKQKFGPHSAKKFDILVTTPNRLVYLLQEGDTPAIDLSNVEWLVIDESDRLFEGGARGFRDQLAVIYQACTSPNIRRALFSATFAYEVQQWCKLNLNNVAMVSVGMRNAASEDVKQELLFCGDEHGKLIALREIFRKGYKPPVLLFVQSKERAKELFRELIYDNIMVDAIHADRTQTQRDNVVRAFRERKIWVLICTELMARGIDFKGVNLVINYDFPQSVISYIHRVGRTGRAHHVGRAVTFWTLDDKPNLRSIAQVIHDSRQEVPEWMLKLKKLNKKEKKFSKRNHPDRGHVTHYDTYKERSRLQEMIKAKKLRKLQKKAKRRETADETASTQGGGVERETEDANHNKVKRKNDNQLLEDTGDINKPRKMKKFKNQLENVDYEPKKKKKKLNA